MDIERTALEWQAGRLGTDAVPDFACEALAQGYDGPKLRMLAGLLGTWGPDLTWEVPDLIEPALREMGIPSRTADEAALALAYAISDDISAGRVEPQAGAKTLYFLWLDHLDVEAMFPLSVFGSLDDLLEDGVAAPPTVEAEILREAAAFARRAESSTPASLPLRNARKAALTVVFVPVVLSFAGLALLLIGYRTAGLVSLIGGIVVRVVFYVAGRLQERAAKP